MNRAVAAIDCRSVAVSITPRAAAANHQQLGRADDVGRGIHGDRTSGGIDPISSKATIGTDGTHDRDAAAGAGQCGAGGTNAQVAVVGLRASSGDATGEAETNGGSACAGHAEAGQRCAPHRAVKQRAAAALVEGQALGAATGGVDGAAEADVAVGRSQAAVAAEDDGTVVGLRTAGGDVGVEGDFSGCGVVVGVGVELQCAGARAAQGGRHGDVVVRRQGELVGAPGQCTVDRNVAQLSARGGGGGGDADVAKTQVGLQRGRANAADGLRAAAGRNGEVGGVEQPGASITLRRALRQRVHAGVVANDQRGARGFHPAAIATFCAALGGDGAVKTGDGVGVVNIGPDNRRPARADFGGADVNACALRHRGGGGLINAGVAVLVAAADQHLAAALCARGVELRGAGEFNGFAGGDDFSARSVIGRRGVERAADFDTSTFAEQCDLALPREGR